MSKKCFKNVLYFIIYLIFILFLVSCTADKVEENLKIKIQKIVFNEVQNRAPKENEFQFEFELFGIVADENLKQDIQYKWIVEYLNLEIFNNNHFIYNNDNSSDIYNTNLNSKSNYFIDVSNNPLNALLSVYKSGYYKITLQASNVKEIEEYSIILKVGEPVFPELFIKFNIPRNDKFISDDFKGNLFLTARNNEKISDIKLEARDIKDKWFSTGIRLNPFYFINIKSGSHKLDNKNYDLTSLIFDNNPSDYINYTVNKKDFPVTTMPIVLNNINQETNITIKKSGNIKWIEGEIFVGFLKWTLNDQEDEFNYFERILNKENQMISTKLNGEYLVKIFIGSIGHRVNPNNYFIYFGPEGTNIEELDPKNQREINSLPYGYLIGKLSSSEKIFPIGKEFYYSYDSNINIYIKDKYFNYIIER